MECSEIFTITRLKDKRRHGKISVATQSNVLELGRESCSVILTGTDESFMKRLCV